MGFDEGYAFGKELAARRIARKDALTDEQHADQRDKYIAAGKAYQVQLSSYKNDKGEVIPEYADQYKKVSDLSTQNEYNLGQLYDPIKAPGRLQADWHYLRERIHGIKQPTPTPTQSPAVTLPAFAPAPITTPEMPAYQQTTPGLPSQGGGVTTTVPGVAATTIPGMAGAPITLPAVPLPKVTKMPWAAGRVQELKDKAMQKAQQEAKTLEAGAGLSPDQQAAVDARGAMAKFKSDEAVNQAKIDETLATAKKLGFSDDEMTELKRQMLNLKPAAFKPLTGAAGQPQLGPDGKTYFQYGSDDNGNVVARPMAAGFKPNTKPARGALVRSKQSPTGFAETFIDPYTIKVVGWIPITASRYYQGTESTKTTTDTAGVTTTSAGVTRPLNQESVDLSTYGQLSSDPTEDVPSPNPAVQPSTAPAGNPLPNQTSKSAAPASVSKPVVAPSPPTSRRVSATPLELKKKIPAPPQDSPTAGKPLETDAQGHIPENAVDVSGKPINPQIREAANQLMDGVDMKDVTLPVKDKPTAEAVARKYGWGRGPYLPRELKQMQNAKQFLDQALNSKAFMKAIDDGFWRKFQTAESEHDASKSGLWDTAAHVLSINNLTPEQQEYLTIRQALMGTVSGLSSVVRTGKATEATINRLAQEIPDVMSSSNSKMAKEKIGQIKKELEVALAQGVPAPTTKSKGNTENNPPDGNTPSLSVVDQWRASHGANHQ
jgi:hypothetical protein